MGYYQGDFYRGTRGDPGFFSFLGGLAKSAAGLIPGVGPGLSAGLSAVLKSAPKAVAPTAAGLASASGLSMIKRGTAAVSSAIIKHPVLSAAGAAGAMGAASGVVAGHMMAAPGAHMKGMHISKKTGRMVRNRHMNVCNPRALRRAVRRAHGFSKLAMRTIHLVHPKKKVRFGGFKKRKRAA